MNILVSKLKMAILLRFRYHFIFHTTFIGAINEKLYFCAMLIINRESKDPYFNLATEEYLVKTLEEPCFMLWQNTASVIIGKHQNPLREVNMDFLKKLQIPIIRRISGGGTVYHDLGNINYSFIDMGKAETLVNFAKYSQPIIDLLQKLDVDAQLVGKSDLKIDGKKFSGNASHVYRNTVLHHGTLLYNSDLNILQESIKINNTQIIDKAVNSNRSTVTNISEHLQQDISLEKFRALLVAHIKNNFPEARFCSLSESQENKIKQLVEQKYKSWEWNFGYSPKYELISSLNIDHQQVKFKVQVTKGFLRKIESDGLLPTPLQSALAMMIDKAHQENAIIETLENQFPADIISQVKSILF